MPSYDVVIVGAGTAGAGAAWQCASRGLRVLCLDARPLAEAGARWINGVARWQLEAAGIPAPAGDEIRAGDHGGFHLISGWGPKRVRLGQRGVLELDMRRLVARLQGMAQGAGAELRGEVHVRGLSGDRLDTSQGPIQAAAFVDASGLGGAHLAQTPRVGRAHICAAAQAVHELVDVDAARAYFAEHGAEPHDTLCFTGVAGGYSIINASVQGDTVSLLTGTIPGDGHPSGRALLDRFVADQPWIGAEQFGGARGIPIRRPFDRLVHGRVALLGDAACQVFSAHGSGIGIGLIAGRLLAEGLAGPGLEAYERRFMREHGGLLAAYDLFRRHSQTLGPRDLDALMSAGVIDGESAVAAMMQRWPSFAPSALPAKLAGLARIPRQATALARVGLRMSQIAGLYRGFPGGQGYAWRAWARAVARVAHDPGPDFG